MNQKKHYSIVIIGAGNVASHLAKRLHKKKYDILQIVSRSENNAKELALKLYAPYTTNLKEINKSADIYIICTPDDSIEKIAKNLSLPKKILLHTSGSAELNELKNCSVNTGVLYPLQSFSKNVSVSFSSVPLLIEASNKATLNTLKELANSLSKHVIEVNATERLKLHLAATMVNNFTNYLFILSHDYLQMEKINEFQLLIPLIKQTVKKIKNQNPVHVQTGAARRGDKKTIHKHISLLKNYPEQKKVYELFSQLIQEHYEPKL